MENTGATDVGVELRLFWGATLLESRTYIAPKTPVLVGETERCDFILSADSLQGEFQILRQSTTRLGNALKTTLDSVAQHQIGSIAVYR